jgi:hypothetical protein
MPVRGACLAGLQRHFDRRRPRLHAVQLLGDVAGGQFPYRLAPLLLVVLATMKPAVTRMITIATVLRVMTYFL